MVVTSRCGDYIINKLNAYNNIYKYNTLNIIKRWYNVVSKDDSSMYNVQVSHDRQFLV